MSVLRPGLGALAIALALAGVVAHAQEEPAPAAESQEATQPEASSEPSPPETTPATVETIPVAIDEPEQPPEERGTRLDTIEVTASKRAKMQRDIPGSVGAIRGQELEKMNAQGMKDYFKLVPGVMYPDQGNEESVPVIRGIATSVSFGATPATTGVYMDEMPFGDLFSPSSIPDLNPFDLERVEILKGPQGTLFGSGALAGAVRYIVQKPEHGLWQAKVNGAFSKPDYSEGLSEVYAAAVNVPLFSDAVALRVVGLQRHEAGVYDQGATDSNGNTLRADQDADGADQTSLRLLGSWKAGDRLALSGFYFDQRTHSDDFAITERNDQPSSNSFPFASPRDHDFGGGNLTATYDFDWGRLFSSSNRMTKSNHIVVHNEFGFGTENQNDNEYVGVADDQVRGWTQEMRLMSPDGGQGTIADWLIGASYLHYGNKGWSYTYLGPDMPEPERFEDISTAEIAAAQVVTTNDQLATETALFGELTARLGAFELTAGARQYETTLDADPVLCGAQVVALFQTLCRPDTYHDKAKGLNPKFSVRYLHDANMQAYVLAAKGFQFGGIQLNPPAPGFPESAQDAGYSFGPYKSSELWNYELGLRTEWLDRRLRLDATLFYLDWKDLQMTVRVPLRGTNLQFGVIANVGRAHSEGLETSLEVRPLPGLSFTSSAAFMSALTDVVFDADANGDGGVPPGTRLPGAPRFQWANVLAYDWAVPYFTGWNLAPSLTHSYIGSSPDQIRPTGEVGGFSTLDARLALAKADSRYAPEISFGVNNLTDARGVSYHVGGNKASDGSPFRFRHFITPRTAVLSVTFKY